MSFLNNSDQSISIMGEEYATFDPTLLIGYDLKFSIKTQVQLSTDIEQNSEEESPEIRLLCLRIFEKKGDANKLEELRIEIMDDLDVAFFLECSVDESSFQTIQANNRLQITFSQFPQSLIELFERSVKAPESIKLKLNIERDYNCVFTICQALRLRLVKVFSLDFRSSPTDFIRSQVQYRFNQLKMDAQQKSQDIETKFAKIKSKNPQFAEQLRKSIMYAVITKGKS